MKTTVIEPAGRRLRASRAAQRNAFTLIELLLVMVILAVLAALVVPHFVGTAQKSKIAAAKTDIATLSAALNRFEVENERFPTSQEGLGALVQQPAGLTSWTGAYIEKLPKDPWGDDYIYRCPGQHNTDGFDLLSMGPDKQEGTADDITNWDSGN